MNQSGFHFSCFKGFKKKTGAPTVVSFQEQQQPEASGGPFENIGFSLRFFGGFQQSMWIRSFACFFPIKDTEIYIDI